MLVSVRHTTSYAYEGRATQFVQVLRLTPRAHDGQEILEWNVRREGGGALEPFDDGLGNLCHLASDRGPFDAVTVVAEGRVRREDTEGVVAGSHEPMPRSYFLRETTLTRPSDAIRDFAAAVAPERPDRFALFDLMAAIHEKVAYEPGETHVETPAAAAFDAGHGVCQDQAHIFVSAARSLGAPARYVGGYVWPGDAEQAARPFASHAWAEVWAEGAGWVGFDPSNGVWVTPAHVRVSVGLDYLQAAPISGRWRGAARERMRVAGVIEAAESSQ